MPLQIFLYKAIVALCLISGVCCFTQSRIPRSTAAAGCNRHFEAIHASPIRVVTSPGVRRLTSVSVAIEDQEGDDHCSGKSKGNLWRFHGRNYWRFSLRHFFHNLFRFRLQHRRKLLASCVLALFVWLGVGGVGGTTVAHANSQPTTTTSIEQVASLKKIKRARNSKTSDLSLGDNDYTVSLNGGGGKSQNQVSSKRAMNGVAATVLASTAVVTPSAAFVIQHQRKTTNSDKEESSQSSPGEDDSSIANMKGNTSVGDEEKTDEQAMVEKVLERAKEARQRVDADAYMKSLQKEKSEISSALETLNKQIQSQEESRQASKPAAAPAAVTTKVATPTTTKAQIVTLETTANVATGSELPLKTRKFVAARKQPKHPKEEERLQNKYKAIPTLEERAYVILKDLGMIESVEPITDVLDEEEEEEPFQ